MEKKAWEKSVEKGQASTQSYWWEFIRILVKTKSRGATPWKVRATQNWRGNDAFRGVWINCYHANFAIRNFLVILTSAGSEGGADPYPLDPHHHQQQQQPTHPSPRPPPMSLTKNMYYIFLLTARKPVGATQSTLRQTTWQSEQEQGMSEFQLDKTHEVQPVENQRSEINYISRNIHEIPVISATSNSSLLSINRHWQ